MIRVLFSATTVAYADFVFDKTEGQVNMCKAIEDLRAEERAKGREEALGWLANFVKSGVLTLEQAAQQTGMTEDEFAKRTGLEL